MAPLHGSRPAPAARPVLPCSVAARLPDPAARPTATRAASRRPPSRWWKPATTSASERHRGAQPQADRHLLAAVPVRRGGARHSAWPGRTRSGPIGSRRARRAAWRCWRPSRSAGGWRARGRAAGRGDARRLRAADGGGAHRQDRRGPAGRHHAGDGRAGPRLAGASRCARGGAALFWLAMGAGILLKGPITPMVAGAGGARLRARWPGRAAWPGWAPCARPGACR